MEATLQEVGPIATYAGISEKLTGSSIGTHHGTSSALPPHLPILTHATYQHIKHGLILVSPSLLRAGSGKKFKYKAMPMNYF